jgi:C4-type Zn-finger protein
MGGLENFHRRVKMLVLKNIQVFYECPKCNDPVSVYWHLARIPFNRLELATQKNCDRLDCKKTSLRITRIKGELERNP